MKGDEPVLEGKAKKKSGNARGQESPDSQGHDSKQECHYFLCRHLRLHLMDFRSFAAGPE